VSDGSTNELFQSRLINCIALTEIYRSRFFSSKAGIEEFMRIFQESALKKVHFYCLLALFYQLCKSIHSFGCSFLHARLKHPVAIINRLRVRCVRHLGCAIVFFKAREDEQGQKTKYAPGMLLRVRKRSRSCYIASTIVYDADLDTIS